MTPGWRRPACRVAATVLALTLTTATVAGCSDDEDSASVADDQLQGLVRQQPLEVGDVMLPDAATGELVGTVPPDGELTVVYFGYTSCPDVCPTTLSDLQRAFEQLNPEAAERIEVAFVTVDPERDNAELLDKYLGYFFERQRALRTEDRAQLEMAQDAFLASSSIDPTGPDTYDVSHSAVTYVVGADGTVLTEWAFGTSSDVMAHDLEILTARAVSGSPTTAPADQT